MYYEMESRRSSGLYPSCLWIRRTQSVSCAD
jgi:hypothetical protein